MLKNIYHCIEFNYVLLAFCKLSRHSTLLIAFFLLILFPVFAQEEEEQEHLHKHRNEMSVATGVVPLPAEDELTIGFHFHYIKGLGESGRLGIGLGFETIIDEHKHYTFSVVGQFRVVAGLSVAYAPGIMIREEHEETLYQLAHHIEAAYEFEFGSFHIGPMVEVGIEEIGVHYMAGLHFGIDF